ncbi:MAG: hypothetical protein ACI399_04870 [Candidatus Cryptobacteroides sp.]
MKKTEKDYAAFEHAMNIDAAYRDNSLDYSGICSLLGLDPAPLEDLLKEELGFTGDEIVSFYRRELIKPL